jgi:putative Ca2+/H+ antiporter (TMEM165/GDT1 family)
MWWEAFLAAFGLVFLAELGDKTQIVILTLSARYGFRKVFLGAAAAFVLLNALAVSIGVVFYDFIPHGALKYIVSGIFIIAGIVSLLQREEDERDRVKRLQNLRKPLMMTFLLICLMEMGDKTQLAIIALAAKYDQALFIFLGGTLALWADTLLGALLGKWIGARLPQVWIHRISGLIFLAIGVANLF